MAKTKNISEIDWRSLSYAEIDSILDARIKAYWKSVEVNGHESKRAGCIIERIACIDNLREADREAQSGKVTKNRFIRRHNEHAEEDLRELLQYKGRSRPSARNRDRDKKKYFLSQT